MKSAIAAMFFANSFMLLLAFVVENESWMDLALGGMLSCFMIRLLARM